MPICQQLTEQEYLRCEATHQGFCLDCDTWTEGVDPGAARVKCQSCGRPGVHGVDQALLLGFLRIRC